MNKGHSSNFDHIHIIGGKNAANYVNNVPERRRLSAQTVIAKG